MSNAGQAALTIVGTVVGGYFGYPQLGYLAGSLAGQALFPTQLPTQFGPRLGAAAATSSVVGSPIPIIFGTQRVGGTVIWASPIREEQIRESVGGKGGPEQEQVTYKYYRSFAVLLCEGPIGGVRRMWANGKLVYSKVPQQPQQPIGGGSFSEVIQGALQQMRNSQYGDKMTVYLGTEDQMPDPVMESFLGAGNVPAYRGYAYVVFDDVELLPEDGLRIPAQLSFEVYESGIDSEADAAYYSNELLFPWLRNPRDFNPANPLNDHGYRAGPHGAVEDQPPLVDKIFDTEEEALAYFVSQWNSYYGASLSLSTAQRIAVGMNHGTSASPQLSMFPYDSFPPGDYFAARIYYNESGASTYDLDINSLVSNSCDQIPHLQKNAHWKYSFGQGPHNARSGGVLQWVSDPYAYGHGVGQGPFETSWFGNNFCEGEGYGIVTVPDVQVRVHRIPRPPDPPAIDRDGRSVILSDFPGWVIRDGVPYPIDAEWERHEVTYKVLQKYEEDTTPTLSNPRVVKYPLNPALPTGHPQYNDEEFWTQAYDIAVARGQMQAGLTYGVDYPVTQNFGYRIKLSFDGVDVLPVTLASIVKRICDRVGLAADVSELENIFVHGYTIPSPMAARQCIEPLRSYGFFDAVPDGPIMRFPVRGKSPVVTLTADDLGAHFATEQRPTSLLSRKAMEYELPRQIRVHYQDISRDYDPGEALSPPRVDTDATQVTDLELAIAMSSEKARHIAEVLIRDAWAARFSHQGSVGVEHSALQPADPIVVPVDGQAHRARIIAITERLPNLRTFELVRDDDDTYVSHAVGTDIAPPRVDVDTAIPAGLVLLDIPALRDSDDDAGVYAAVYSLVGAGTFRGASIFRSADGVAYESTVSATTQTPVGDIAFPVGASAATVWDETNSIVVTLRHPDMVLESRTSEDLLEDGANAAAIGQHGRWEIVQFRDAEHVGGTTWRLTGLLRGRRGTEHAIGTSDYGDVFVLLSAGSVVRVPMAVSAVHREYTYKAVAPGLTVSGAPTQTFTGRGVSLMPFSPVHITGDRDDDGNLTISWVRRDRFPVAFGGAEVPMSEAVEDYEVDILDGAAINPKVVRTISVSSEQAIYTNEQQVTDFGELQESVMVRVYQISVAVGRGYPGEATV